MTDKNSKSIIINSEALKDIIVQAVWAGWTKSAQGYNSEHCAESDSEVNYKLNNLAQSVFDNNKHKYF